MSRQAWRTTGNSTTLSQKILRDKIYNDPGIQRALVRYLGGQNLQGQIDKGLITENQALELFDNALRNFTRDTHTKINQAFTANQLDQKNYDPNNLQDPLSPLNTFLDNQMQIINDDINNQIIAQQSLADENDSAQQATTQSTQTIQGDQQNNQNSPMNDVEKCAAVGIALKLIDDADPKMIEAAEKAVEKSFHEITGVKGGMTNDMKNELKNAEEDAKKEFTPKHTPQPPKEDKK